MNKLSSEWILAIVVIYFALLLIISFWTSRQSKSEDFYNGSRQSPWYLVAFGMIGASLSGVSFISIPGAIGKIGSVNGQFSYMQMVFGYLIGYFIIATVLLPIYYQLNLTSIYTYLEKRFGFWSYKTGAVLFIVSRVIGAAFRLYLVAMVLNTFVFEPMGVPIYVTVAITILLILLYTFKSGLKTIVYTDTFQTAVMLGAIIATIVVICQDLQLGWAEIFPAIQEANLGKMFFFDSSWNTDPNYFFKQVLSGAAIAIVMTGLDQDMMQKNLSCKSLPEAQKNIFWFSSSLVLVNFIILVMGALLYLYAYSIPGFTFPERTDNLFPMLSLQYLPIGISIAFIIGLIAAAYSSADSALTALTTSFCIDILGIHEKDENAKSRRIVHFSVSILLYLVILLFWWINNDSVVNQLFTYAGYTYGPLLGLYAIGLFTKIQIKDTLVPLIAIIAPVLTYILTANSVEWFGYKFGFELLIVNGSLTALGLLLSSFLKESRQKNKVL